MSNYSEVFLIVLVWIDILFHPNGYLNICKTLPTHVTLLCFECLSSTVKRKVYIEDNIPSSFAGSSSPNHPSRPRTAVRESPHSEPPHHQYSTSISLSAMPFHVSPFPFVSATYYANLSSWESNLSIVIHCSLTERVLHAPSHLHWTISISLGFGRVFCLR